ncbi:MAG TPA: sulfatase [Thermoanaerobaculia bacterium]|nr:sulfatase [Thermoanaerobaculia bacterium]
MIKHSLTAARRRPGSRATVVLLAVSALFVALLAASDPAAAQSRRRAAAVHRSPPNVVLVTIDTLRADRLSGYGYGRPTSPVIDRLLARGAHFEEARTVEPLTQPASASLLTSLHPHEHGATRNGLRLRPGLDSLPKQLDRRGYLSAAFVANWTLKDKISGLGEHFDLFEEVFTRKRWLGLFASEATATDVNQAAIEWLDGHAGRRRPVFLWVHYVEPHAPYELHEKMARRIGVPRNSASKSDRYDTEVAYVDQAVGALVRRIESDARLAGNTLIVVTSDHGESLGEHDYWGHGRHLYEPGLRIPLALYWPGKIRPQRVAAPATLLDLAPTVLGLLGHPSPETFRGFDWTEVLAGRAEPDPERRTWYEAHKGAVLSIQEAGPARKDGLLELAMLTGSKKEIVQVNQREHRVYDLRRDPRELRNLNGAGYRPSDPLAEWISRVEHILEAADDAPPVNVDAEDIEKLRSLGYID